MRPSPIRNLISCAVALVLLAARAGYAEPLPAAGDDAADLAELSLQELTNLKVTSAAKRPQRAADVAAAVFVITQDDIRRSGATSIPEALRLAPGLQVAQIDGSRWAISARGFSGKLANKLLVLMDGRTLYTPSFGGVYWDAHDTLIDDIERIEVIRGPAGTTWGSNAVNGIINIITKRADQTDGLLIGAEGGFNDESTLSVRFGQADDRVQWRVYAKALDRPPNEQLNGAAAYDDFEQQRVGARFDADVGDNQNVRAAFEAYQGHSYRSFTGSFLEPTDPLAPLTRGDEPIDGVWGTAGWSRDLANESHVELQAYIDHSSRPSPVYNERRDTVDLELQYISPRLGAHTLSAGAGARRNFTYVIPVAAAAASRPNEQVTLLSAYFQDEIALADDRVTVTVGARVEDTDIDDTTVLPNLRARFSVSDRATLWGAVAQGVRRPARIEQDFDVPQIGEMLEPGSPQNPFPLPVAIAMSGTTAFGHEELTAYEMGWRWQSAESFSLDAALFYNDYERLRTSGTVAPYCAPGGELVAANPACLFYSTHVVVPTTISNSAQGSATGGEVVLTWAPLSQWRLTGAYSHIEKDLTGVPSDPSIQLLVLGQDAGNEYSLRSSLSIGPRWDFDVLVKHRDAIEEVPLDASTQLDARLAWRPTIDLELALVGRNLLEDAQVQAVSELYDVGHTAIKRSGFLQVRWSFR